MKVAEVSLMADLQDQVDTLEGAIAWCVRHGAIVDFSDPKLVSIRVRGQTFMDKTFLDALWEALPNEGD